MNVVDAGTERSGSNCPGSPFVFGSALFVGVRKPRGDGGVARVMLQREDGVAGAYLLSAIPALRWRGELGLTISFGSK